MHKSCVQMHISYFCRTRKHRACYFIGMYRIRLQFNSNEKKVEENYERKVTTLYENNLTLKAITLI